MAQPKRQRVGARGKSQLVHERLVGKSVGHRPQAAQSRRSERRAARLNPVDRHAVVGEGVVGRRVAVAPAIAVFGAGAGGSTSCPGSRLPASRPAACCGSESRRCSPRPDLAVAAQRCLAPGRPWPGPWAPRRARPGASTAPAPARPTACASERRLAGGVVEAVVAVAAGALDVHHVHVVGVARQKLRQRAAQLDRRPGYSDRRCTGRPGRRRRRTTARSSHASGTAGYRSPGATVAALCSAARRHPKRPAPCPRSFAGAGSRPAQRRSGSARPHSR